MAFVQNDTVWQSRGTQADDYEDDVPSTEPLRQDIPISITSTVISGVASETGRAYSVEQFTGLVDPRVDIRKGDWLHSQRTRNVFEVLSVGSTTFLGFPQELALRLIST